MSPVPGSPNNPNGFNGTEGVEQPYGAVKRLAQQTAAAPLPANRALASPKRAQRQAQRGTAPAASGSGPVPHPATALPMAYQPQLAQVWQQIAQTPGASPLIQMIAQQVQSGAA